MKVDPPADPMDKWINHRFYCKCGSLITLEKGDPIRQVAVRVLWIFRRAFWFFHCPVCNEWVRFDDRHLDYY